MSYPAQLRASARINCLNYESATASADDDDFASFAAPPTLTRSPRYRLFATKYAIKSSPSCLSACLPCPPACLASPRVHSALFEMRYWD